MFKNQPQGSKSVSGLFLADIFNFKNTTSTDVQESTTLHTFCG